MRMMIIGVVAAATAGFLALVLAARGKVKAMMLAPCEPRRAAPDMIARASLPAARVARAASLWTDAAGVQCRFAADWATGPARFAPTMRLALKAPQAAPAVAARAAAWVAREQIVAAAANDADVASRLVTLDRGATPVVRVLRFGAFPSRRAGQRRAA